MFSLAPSLFINELIEYIYYQRLKNNILSWILTYVTYKLLLFLGLFLISIVFCVFVEGTTKVLVKEVEKI